MIRYIIRRLIALVAVLVVVSMFTFGIFFLIPKVAGVNAAVLFGPRVCDAGCQAGISKKLELDKPIPVQYEHYISGIFFGRDFNNGSDKTHCGAPCFGYSFKQDLPVSSLLANRLPVMFGLAIGAAIIWLVAGVLIGILSALRRGSIFDRAAMSVALAGVSLPIYFTGLLALAVFSYGPSWLRITPDPTFVPFTQNPLKWAHSMLFPWITLAFLFSAIYARLTRAGMLETMSEDYVRTARAKGLKERTVIRRHGLRAALTPIVTVFGLDLGQLLGGAVLTETVFSLPGIGKLSIDAIGQQDLPIILGTVLLAAFFIVLANLIVDVLYAVVDPRVRYN